MEVPSTDPRDPTPELRLIGSVSSTNTSRRPTSWNSAGGAPALVETIPLPHIRLADFDGNGAVTLSDLMAYLNAFLSGRMDADSNADGVLSISDLMRYLDDWFR
jgi:hypothetical protein